MDNKYSLDKSKKVFPMIMMIIGLGIMAAQLITRLNFVSVVAVAYCCIVSALIFISLIVKKKVYLPMLLGYGFAFLGVTVFHIVCGADAGFGAFTSGHTGWSTADNALFAGTGNFFTRLLGNILLSLPVIITFLALFFNAKKKCDKTKLKGALSFFLSVLFMGASVFQVLFMNMRTKPVTERLWEGHDDYLKNVDKVKSSTPNVLVILMDDLGYGDIGINGSLYDTPSIDSIGENGLNFENFYSSYSVCSPARFACLTGRYPYSALSFFLSVLFMGASVFQVLFMNMRTKPVTERLWEGHDDYLKNVDKVKSSTPNVLVILMDDLGYGDIGINGSLYDTPSIDSIGENGLNFENFYSSYSVCSPARFACLTGRYPYRGYADNVIYPTVSTLSPFAQTRIFNSIEMGNNCDGMLGDEITIAEVFQNAGYSTGCFGKWHLGDYGEYLPTNQGFDYFYGSHHVNDMAPFYHAVEKNGEYEIVHGTEEMKDENGKKDQGKLTEWIHDEITSWITEKAQNNEPFFAYYTSPWPHAPVFVGEDYEGVSGMGTYVDCITEFDAYLGKLFNSMEELGVLEDTIIVFTSDNGPALEGSVADLRGGKYLAYEGGQKVPFMIRWDNNNGIFEKGGTREQSATLVDLFPTLIEMCNITGNGGKTNYLPTDREIDGVSMLPVIKSDEVVHTKEHPILHMKREDIKAIQYTVSTESVKSKEEYKDYNYSVLNDHEYITFKYFDKIQNDNSAFWDKNRKNWLHILTDDHQENYNRTPVYPTISDEMHEKLDEIQADFAANRRGIIE